MLYGNIVLNESEATRSADKLKEHPVIGQTVGREVSLRIFNGDYLEAPI